jgi:hypothetical protein
MPSTDIWPLIDTLAHALPFRKEPLERLLDARVEKTSENDYFVFYKMQSRAPGPVTAIDLRVKKNAPDHPGFLWLAIAGPHISELVSRYPEGSIAPAPPGNLSEDPEYTFAVKESWGTLMFGISSKTGRVKSIAFHPGE